MPRSSKPFWDPTTRAWRLRFRKVLPDGTVKRFWHLCTGYRNYSQALIKAGQIMGSPVTMPEVGSVAEAIEAWLARHPGEYRRRMLQPLYRHAGAWPLSAVRSEFLADYRDWLSTAEWIDVNQRIRQGYKPKSIRGYVGYAHTLFQWCAHRDRQFIEAAPDLPELPVAPKGHRHVPPRTLREAWEELPKQAKAILTFILLTGCRPGEACRLEWRHVNIEGGVCVLSATEHKTGLRTGRDRTIFLTDAAKLILHAQFQNRSSRFVFLSRLKRPYTPSGLRKILDRHGIPGGAYRLRHTWAQDARRQGLDLGTISLWLDHTSIKTTEIYVEIEKEEAHQAARSLASPLRPPPADTIAPATTDAGGRRRPAKGRRAQNAG